MKYLYNTERSDKDSGNCSYGYKYLENKGICIWKSEVSKGNNKECSMGAAQVGSYGIQQQCTRGSVPDKHCRNKGK